MEIQSIIDIITNNFNFGLIISINALVYALVTIYESIKKQSAPKWLKILITILSCSGMGITYLYAANISIDVVLSSCVSAPLIWDWIIKPILKKFKVDYKKEE